MVPSRRLSLIAVLAASLLGAGCTRINPLYCEQDMDCDSYSCNVTKRECNPVQACTDSSTCSAPNAPICDTDLGYCVPCEGPGPSTECEAHDQTTTICTQGGRCVECLVDDACGASSPICDQSDNACRGCRSSGECIALQNGTDICSPTGQCVACLNHGDCNTTSQVCDRETHTCADPADVFYVDATDGSDVGGCGTSTSDSPCKTVEFALAVMGNEKFLHVAGGNYSGNIAIVGGSLSIVGPGVIFAAGASDQPVLSVNGGATLVVDGMTLRGANGNNAHGIACSDASTLTMYDVRVTGNEARGINSVGCIIAMMGGKSDGNSDLGIAAISGSVTISGAEVFNNSEGGVHLLDAEYDIINNFIVENGRGAAGGSDIGGVRLDNASQTGPQRFAFNTVAGNNARTGATSSGVHCDTSGQATPVITSNLVWGNAGGAANYSGGCPWRYSNIEGYDQVGVDGNIDEDPKYDDVLNGNYHLRSGSACIDAGESLAEILFDFDIEPRGQGNGYDIGADEVE